VATNLGPTLGTLLFPRQKVIKPRSLLDAVVVFNAVTAKLVQTHLHIEGVLENVEADRTV
jgi:hypothetical protein